MVDAAEQIPVVYGDEFCPSASRLKQELQNRKISFEWRDVYRDPNYQPELKKLARGNLSVPTVVFPDGTVMVEPSTSAVLNKLNPQQSSPGILSRLFKRSR